LHHGDAVDARYALSFILRQILSLWL
jgi:hypothetical protein